MRRSIFGYALVGKAMARKYPPFDIYDDSFKNKAFDELANAFYPSSYFKPSKSSLELVSPGFAPHNPLVLKAKHLCSEYDFFYPAMPRSLWISGTNGKSTTTKMSELLLADFGAKIGGNIGKPLADMDMNASIWILETSSFTLHYTKLAYPELFVLLPIKDDHLNWHKSLKAYEEAKLSPLLRMQRGQIAIIPQKYQHVKTKARLICYENEEDLANKMQIDLFKIRFKSPFLLDALLALSIEKIIALRLSYDLINSYEEEPHKIEEFKDKNDFLWVDDSKATNTSATKAALIRYKHKKIHLILGGDDKAGDLQDFFKELQNYELKCYLIGKSTEKMAKLCQDFKLIFSPCFTLEKAVNEIKEAIKLGEIAILSPACASLDQFSSYKERGELFKSLVLG